MCLCLSVCRNCQISMETSQRGGAKVGARPSREQHPSHWQLSEFGKQSPPPLSGACQCCHRHLNAWEPLYTHLHHCLVYLSFALCSVCVREGAALDSATWGKLIVVLFYFSILPSLCRETVSKVDPSYCFVDTLSYLFIRHFAILSKHFWHCQYQANRTKQFFSIF